MEEFDVLFKQEMFWFWPILVRQMGRDDIVAAIFKAFNSQLTLGIRVTRLHAWLANNLSASFCLRISLLRPSVRLWLAPPSLLPSKH